MLAHLALATALFMAAGHLAPPLPDSPEGAVILTTPDTRVREPRPCPPAGTQPLYRDLSGHDPDPCRTPHPARKSRLSSISACVNASWSCSP